MEMEILYEDDIYDCEFILNVIMKKFPLPNRINKKHKDELYKAVREVWTENKRAEEVEEPAVGKRFVVRWLVPATAVAVAAVVLFMVFLPRDNSRRAERVVDVNKMKEAKVETKQLVFGEKIDDWEYDSEKRSLAMTNRKTMSTSPEGESGGGWGSYEEMGIGGGFGDYTDDSKGVGNFRESVDKDYMPMSYAMTYEGLFHEYYSEIFKEKDCGGSFCPAYDYAVSPDPISGKEDTYLSIDLNSNEKNEEGDGAQREKLNLVVALDVSSSMKSSFKGFYYDEHYSVIDVDRSELEFDKTKMQIAKETIVKMLGNLKDEDRFGMVIFDDEAYVAKSLRYVGETDMEAIKDHILKVEPDGGTNMSLGIGEAAELFKELEDAKRSGYENRVVFITDDAPSLDEIGENGIFGISEKNSDKNIYTTFMGLDAVFDQELVKKIEEIKGAGYGSFSSAKEFRRALNEKFLSFVSPNALDLTISLESDGYKIDKVYGASLADETKGEILKVRTLFPSFENGIGVDAGVVLVKLRKESDIAEFGLKFSYEDASGNRGSKESIVKISESGTYYESDEIRKEILLARYADLVKNWIIDERIYKSHGFGSDAISPSVNIENGIVANNPNPALDQKELRLMPISVSAHYEGIFKNFVEYFSDEIDALGDKTLRVELDILKRLGRV